MTFAPISKITATIYKVDDILVNSCVMIFLISFVLLNFASVTIIEKLGLKLTVSKLAFFVLHLACIVLAKCAWYNYWSMGPILCLKVFGQFHDAIDLPEFHCDLLANDRKWCFKACYVLVWR